MLVILKFILMKGKVKQWGNSLGIRIPKVIAEEMNLKDGINLEMKLSGRELIISRAKYDLGELLAQVNSANKHDEIDWGKSVGKEIW
jgi:antitoxin MazE